MKERVKLREEKRKQLEIASCAKLALLSSEEEERKRKKEEEEAGRGRERGRREG